ncbi:hypothetical protein Chor_014669 [Crotalus horridus]
MVQMRPCLPGYYYERTSHKPGQFSASERALAHIQQLPQEDSLPPFSGHVISAIRTSVPLHKNEEPPRAALSSGGGRNDSHWSRATSRGSEVPQSRRRSPKSERRLQNDCKMSFRAVKRRHVPLSIIALGRRLDIKQAQMQMFRPSGLPKLAFGKLKTKSHTEKAASLRKLAYYWKHGCKIGEEMTDRKKAEIKAPLDLGNMAMEKFLISSRCRQTRDNQHTNPASNVSPCSLHQTNKGLVASPLLPIRIALPIIILEEPTKVTTNLLQPGLRLRAALSINNRGPIFNPSQQHLEVCSRAQNGAGISLERLIHPSKGRCLLSRPLQLCAPGPTSSTDSAIRTPALRTETSERCNVRRTTTSHLWAVSMSGSHLLKFFLEFDDEQGISAKEIREPIQKV